MELTDSKHPTFAEYVWKQGVPHGIGSGESYRIIADPYRRRYSIEKYAMGNFCELVYDSILLDFRDLHPRAHMAWRKELVEETPEKVTHLIRNQDDRILFREVNYFKNHRCTKCQISTPFDYLLSTHQLYYMDQGDPFNGVKLFDREGKVVMVKRYAFSKEEQTFTDLLAEEWEISG